MSGFRIRKYFFCWDNKYQNLPLKHPTTEGGNSGQSNKTKNLMSVSSDAYLGHRKSCFRSYSLKWKIEMWALFYHSSDKSSQHLGIQIWSLSVSLGDGLLCTNILEVFYFSSFSTNMGCCSKYITPFWSIPLSHIFHRKLWNIMNLTCYRKEHVFKSCKYSLNRKSSSEFSTNIFSL